MELVKSVYNSFFANETFNLMPSHEFLMVIAEVLSSPFSISFFRTISTFVKVFHIYPPIPAGGSNRA